MARKGTISISFRIDEGKDGLRNLTFDAQTLRKVLEENAQAAERVQSKFFKVAAAATAFKGVADSVNQINSVLTDITQESMDFSGAMKAANTMAGKDAAGFEQLKDQVAELSKSIPVARDELANGLYQVISNGVPEDNWIGFLNKSARSAVGGIADLGQVVGVTSTVIKNYGLGWEAAGDIQDKIQLTAKNGVTSFEQLASALPRVTGNAATLGVSIDELMASFATLTGVSGNTAEVSTQLAAIFTALIKPCSEATKTAEAMGIQFDAAAIKAAGGMHNFLRDLDRSVKSYAQSTGQEIQTIYGSLFGSAESLRALTPLQGELAAKFKENIDGMAASAGTMDAAYANMSSTGSAATQMFKNQWGVVTDLIASVTSGIQPYLNFGASLLVSMSSVATLTTAFKSLNIQQMILTTRSKFASVAMVALGLSGKSSAAVMRVFSAALRSGAYSATAFKIALKGLMITSVVGIAIVAVTTAIEHFMSATDEAADSTDNLIDSTERAKRTAESLKEMQAQEAETLKSTRAALELNIAKLKEFNGTKEEEKRVVAEMNETYGQTMGYFSSVADWYKTLVANSETYCRQMVLEARTRQLANQIAEKEQQKHDIIYNPDGTKKRYDNTRASEVWLTPEQIKSGRGKKIKVNDAHGKRVINTGFERDVDRANYSVATLDKEIAHLNGQLSSATKEVNGLSFSVTGAAEAPRTGGGVVSGADSGKGGHSGGHTGSSEKSDPVYHADPKNLLEITENLSVLDTELKSCTDPKRQAEINRETAALQKQADAIRRVGIEVKDTSPKYDAHARSIAGVEANVKALTEERDKASDPKEIADLNDRIELWESLAETLRNAGKETTDATAKYNAGAKTIAAMTANVDVLNARLEEAGDIDTAAQINREIAVWQKKIDKMREAGTVQADVFKELRGGYDATKGIVTGVENITGALEGNKSTWESITGVIDGALQVYDGINAVITMIKTLQTALGGVTAATQAGAAADSAAAAEKVASSGAVTTANVAEAASGAMAAHSDIPFAGIAMGLAAVAAIVAMMASLPKFANGGIVSGPTLGLMGEYAGASNNPEVIAPLDRLRKLITPAGQSVVVGGTLRVSGRDLVCVLANETRIAGKSGRRTNIKI